MAAERPTISWMPLAFKPLHAGVGPMRPVQLYAAESDRVMVSRVMEMYPLLWITGIFYLSIQTRVTL